MGIAAGAIVSGRYLLEERVGEGGMGTVWKATHLVTRKPVALTWDRMGIVVPAARYRRLSVNLFSGYSVDPQRPQVEQLTAEASPVPHPPDPRLAFGGA